MNETLSQDLQHSPQDNRLALLLASLIAIGPFSIDVYLPAIPTIATALQADIHRVELTLGIFLLGLALGQLSGGPFADAKGLKRTALLGLSFYILTSFAAAFVSSVDQLLVIRLLQALSTGISTVVAVAAVRVSYSGAKAARMIALVGVIMLIAPLIAPMVGSLLLNTFGWRSIFIFLSVYSSFVFVLIFMFMPKQAVSEHNNSSLNLRSIVDRYLEVFKQTRALGFLFFQAFSFSSMFAFITESSFVYMEIYGVSDKVYPLIFGLNVVVMIVFNRFTAYKLKTVASQKLLYMGMAIQIICNLILFIMALLFSPSIEWVVAFVMFSVGSQGLVVVNTMAGFMAFFRENAATANALLGTSQFALGATVGWITATLHNGTLLPMTSMMLASSLLGFTLFYLFTLRRQK